MQRERDTAYGLTLVWALVAVCGSLFRQVSPVPAAVAQTGGAAMQRERDTAYGLTLVWALVAVCGSLFRQVSHMPVPKQAARRCSGSATRRTG